VQRVVGIDACVREVLYTDICTRRILYVESTEMRDRQTEISRTPSKCSVVNVSLCEPHKHFSYIQERGCKSHRAAADAFATAHGIFLMLTYVCIDPLETCLVPVEEGRTDRQGRTDVGA
jgi:hypothetical protein